MKKYLNIWKNNASIRADYNNDLNLYIEAMQCYLDACDEFNQVS